MGKACFSNCVCPVPPSGSRCGSFSITRRTPDRSGSGAVAIPIEADESCFSIHDAARLVQEEAADVLNIKIAKAGGLVNSLKIAAIAKDAGLDCVLGTAFGMGPKIAAKLLLASAIGEFTGAVEFTELGLHGPMIKYELDEALSLPLSADGCLPVPTGAGLGVTIDQEQIEMVTE